MLKKITMRTEVSEIASPRSRSARLLDSETVSEITHATVQGIKCTIKNMRIVQANGTIRVITETTAVSRNPNLDVSALLEA